MNIDAPLAAALPASDETRAAPVARHARVADIDVIRGIALFGVLMMNLTYAFRVPMLGMASQEEHGIDHALERLGMIVLSSKAMTLFSILFGVGLAIFFDRARARGASGMLLLVRRLTILLVFGVAHLFLLWIGDILIAYSLAGACSLIFLRRRPRVLAMAIAVLTLLPFVLSFWPAFKAVTDVRPDGHYERALRAYATGSYLGIVRFRAWEITHILWHFYVPLMPIVVRNVLIGMLVWRSGILGEPMRYARALRWTALVGILGGAAHPVYRVIYSELYHPPRRPWSSWRVLLDDVTVPMQALGYAAGILLLLHGTTRWRRWLGAFAPLGRMAFTNYLTESIVFSTLFYGYGFALIGHFGYAFASLLGIAFYAVQGAASAWWLQRFQFGPFEWVWRSLTYGQWQPMRQKVAGEGV